MTSAMYFLNIMSRDGFTERKCISPSLAKGGAGGAQIQMTFQNLGNYVWEFVSYYNYCSVLGSLESYLR